MATPGLDRRQFLKVAGGAAARVDRAIAAPGPTASAGRPLVVDMHVHLGFAGKYADPGAVVQLADEAGIDWLCGSPGVAAARRFPGRIVPFLSFRAPDLRPELLDELERGVLRDGVKGLGEITTPRTRYIDTLPATSPGWIALFKKAAALRIPMLLHQRPVDAEAIAERVPEGTILMAHMGNGDAEGNWRRAIQAAQRYPNIFLETSSSTVDLGYIETAVEVLGHERLFFGTDLPLLDPHVQVAKITGAAISDEAKRAILGGNAARLLGLGTGGRA